MKPFYRFYIYKTIFLFFPGTKNLGKKGTDYQKTAKAGAFSQNFVSAPQIAIFRYQLKGVKMDWLLHHLFVSQTVDPTTNWILQYLYGHLIALIGFIIMYTLDGLLRGFWKYASLFVVLLLMLYIVGGGNWGGVWIGLIFFTVSIILPFYLLNVGAIEPHIQRVVFYPFRKLMPDSLVNYPWLSYLLNIITYFLFFLPMMILIGSMVMVISWAVHFCPNYFGS